jgi:hypothetical protein
MWAPDGSYLMVHRRSGATQDLVALPVDGGEPCVLIGGFVGVHSSLDRDMRRVVTDAYRYEGEGRGAVLLYDLSTGRREVVCAGVHKRSDHTTGSHIHPQWSRDETRIIFNLADSGAPQVYAVEV